MPRVTGEDRTTSAAIRRQPGGPAKGDRRRQAIVDAVEQLLQERSIAELSVEDIAAAAGISRSGFYFYFESKYAALGDALSDIADDMVRAADDFFGDTNRPPVEYVPDALRGVAELWHRHADLMVAIVDASHSDAGARAIWDDWRERFIVSIASSLQDERAAGRSTGGPAPEVLARALLAMNLGVLYDDASRRASDAEIEGTVEAMTRVWLATVWGIDSGS
jgi:TetR/AcrR family transcriptional regulator, ethionamide resistance regulator